MITPAEADLLLDIAEQAILDGLSGHPAPVPAPTGASLPPALLSPAGVFVTLTVDGQLNGCIGSVAGVEPLGGAVARLAWSAAFADPRLPALRPADHERLTIEVSVLSPLEPIPADSRADLVTQLRPRVDGLVIAAGDRESVFLPAVWDQLPEPTAFLDHLQLKAGLVPGWWPPGMQAWRFTAERFHRRPGQIDAPFRAA